jgi:hypothetical protein
MKSMSWLESAQNLGDSAGDMQWLAAVAMQIRVTDKKKPAKPMAMRVSGGVRCVGRFARIFEKSLNEATQNT